MSRLRLALSALVLALCACAPAQPAAQGPGPVVVATKPGQGEVVDPRLAEIRVQFSAPMQPMGYSIVREDAGTFPRMTGQPRQSETLDAFTVPVALEPGRDYVLWFNSSAFRNFKDREGRAAEPYRLAFRTAPE